GDMRLSQEILNAAARAEDLLVSVRAWPLDMECDGQHLRGIRHSLENALEELAHSLEEAAGVSEEAEPGAAVTPGLYVNGAEPVCFAATIDKQTGSAPLTYRPGVTAAPGSASSETPAASSREWASSSRAFSSECRIPLRCWPSHSMSSGHARTDTRRSSARAAAFKIS